MNAVAPSQSDELARGEVSLSGIHIHPVKSCRRIEVKQATVTALGLEHDRVWQVVDGDGTPVTQRQRPAMATVQPRIDAAGLCLTAPGIDDIVVGAPSVLTPSTPTLSLFGIDVPAGDAGDDAADWFSQVLGVDVRLVAIVEDAGWHLPDGFKIHSQPLAFVDAAPVLVASTSSLDWLTAKASEPFGMDRFRPNLIVDGAEPWAEDTWSDFRIGSAVLQLAMPWPRCPIPQVDQDSGTRHREPALALKEHRWCTSADGVEPGPRRALEGKALFGIGCSIGVPGTVVSVGDRVQVTGTREPLLPAPNQ